MKQSSLLTLIFAATFLFLAVGISALAVTDPVESNYTLTALEMVQSGDWISPQIYGIYWYDKPIFLYWLLSLSYSVFGATDFASRLPAVLFGAMSCTLAAWFALRQTQRTATAVLFAAMTATSLAVWLISRSVITDQPLFFFSGATLFFAFIGLTEAKKNYVIAAYVMAAGAVLTKGPVGLVLPGLFLLLFAIIQRNAAYAKRLFPPIGIALFLLLVLSWYGPMYRLHGQDFIDGFLGFNNVVRATVSEHPKDNVWYYYLVLVPVSLLPWTGPCLYGLWKRRRRDDTYVFMAVWAIGTILFYSLMATKYPTYAYIANWPLLYLGAWAIDSFHQEDRHRLWLIVIIPALLFGLLFAALNFFTSKAPFPVDGLLLLTIFIAIMAFLILLAWWQKAYIALPILITAMTAVTYLIVTFQVLIPFYQYRSAQSLTTAPITGQAYFFEEYRTSYPYYTGKTAIWTSAGKSDKNSTQKRDAVWAKKYLYPKEEEASVINRLQNHQDLTLIVPRSQYQNYLASNFAPLTRETAHVGSYYLFTPAP